MVEGQPHSIKLDSSRPQ